MRATLSRIPQLAFSSSYQELAPDIEEGVVAQTVGLVYLKIETDGGHAISSRDKLVVDDAQLGGGILPADVLQVLHGNCGLPRRPAGDRQEGRRSLLAISRTSQKST